MEPTRPIRPERIRSALRGSTFWNRLVYLDRVGSTNDVAKELASKGAPEGTIVVADEQTAGRGRMNRRWIAPPGTGLLVSILFRPNLSPQQTNRLTMLCSMAAADAIEHVAGQHMADLPVALKWPNDLVVASRRSQGASTTWRKLAGVLTETGLTGEEVDFAVVGVGINVNVPPTTLPQLAPDATSILAETDRSVDQSTLLISFLQTMEQRYKQLRRGHNPRREWEARLMTIGQRIQVATGQGPLEGIAEGVDRNGALLLRTDDGTVHRLLTGDVTLSGA